MKPQHYHEAIDAPGAVDFFEVHAENFMGAGGPPHRWLTLFREMAPVSVHGVCLSVGGRDRLDRDHLRRFAELVDRYQPALVSEHLAWSADQGIFFNDLLAPPLTKETLMQVANNVDEIQSTLARSILIENPSAYAPPLATDIPEPEFLNELARISGCEILLDINNVYVSALNCGFDPYNYIDAIDAGHVGEMHMAGHSIDRFEGRELRIDNHGAPPCTEVTDLYKYFVERAGPRPTLLEWDTDIPSFATLLAESARIRSAMRETSQASCDAI